MTFKIIFHLLAVLYLASGSKIYELKCWTRTNHKHYSAPGLEKSDHIDDDVECIKECQKINFCRAVDIDKETIHNCWLQTQDVAISKDNLRPKSSVTNYLLNPTCAEITRGVDLNCWTVTPAYHILGLTKIDSKNLEDCLKKCIDNNYCSVVDYDVNTFPKCWIQMKPMEVSLSKLFPMTSVTNFILNRDCLTMIGSIDMRFWRVSAQTGYSAPGLIPVDMWDLRSCINYCQTNENCNMFDFDRSTSPPCWAQTIPFALLRGELVDKKTCYNFLFLREEYTASVKVYDSSLTGTIKVEEETSCWFFQNDTTYSGLGLKRVPSVTNLDKCLDLCFRNSKCGAVTFEEKSKIPCSRVNAPVEITKFRDKVGVITYMPNRDCSDMTKK